LTRFCLYFGTEGVLHFEVRRSQKAYNLTCDTKASTQDRAHNLLLCGF
jgi:hypothetical protein